MEVAAPPLAPEVPIAAAETIAGDYPLQGALLDWMASSSILGATVRLDEGRCVWWLPCMLQ